MKLIIKEFFMLNSGYLSATSTTDMPYVCVRLIISKIAQENDKDIFIVSYSELSSLPFEPFLPFLDKSTNFINVFISAAGEENDRIVVNECEKLKNKRAHILAILL